MTTAEVVKTSAVRRAHASSTEHNDLNVNDNGRERQADAMYTSEEVLAVVLAAYERGYDAGRSRTAREHWNSPAVAEPLRAERAVAGRASMRHRADQTYLERGLPTGYTYRGGAVDWATGLPAGSGCAWLRRKKQYGLEVAA